MPDYRALTRQIAHEEGIDPNYFYRQIEVESGFNPKARSPAGALGIAQIVPQYHPGVDPWDPIASLRYAARYDAKLLKQYGGDWRPVLSVYNSGKADKWKDPDFADGQTFNYVRAVLGDSYKPGAGTVASGQTWNHQGVVRGVVEAFYDPLGSWDISTGTGGFGGPIGKHNDHVHVSDTDPESMIFLINVAQRMGLTVHENPYTDPNIDGNHVPGTFHRRFFEGLYNGKKLGMGADIYGTAEQMSSFYTLVTKQGQGNKLPGNVPEITYSNGATRSVYTPESMSTDDRIQAPFMEMVLRGMGAPVTESNMRFLAGWASLENTAALNNPLASTRAIEGRSTTLAGNSAGVQNYSTPEEGVEMTVAHLLDYTAIARLLRAGDASRMLHGNKAVYAELNLWGGKGAGKPYMTDYTNAIENRMRNVDPYANARGITDGDYPNMSTPENSPATGTPPPTDRSDLTPEWPIEALSDVPGWTPNVIRPGSLYDRSYDDPAHSNMLADVWAQVASDESVSAEAQRFARMYGV